MKTGLIYNNRLSKNDVIEICRLIDICKKFNIKKNTIGDLSRGCTWRNVTNGLKYPILRHKEENKQLFHKIV